MASSEVERSCNKRTFSQLLHVNNIELRLQLDFKQNIVLRQTAFRAYEVSLTALRPQPKVRQMPTKAIHFQEEDLLPN